MRGWAILAIVVNAVQLAVAILIVMGADGDSRLGAMAALLLGVPIVSVPVLWIASRNWRLLHDERSRLAAMLEARRNG